MSNTPSKSDALSKTAPWLRVENLSKSFDLSGLGVGQSLGRWLTGKARASLTAVDNVSFSITQGETYALVGESGSGKSTIARMIVGLLKPSKGRIITAGHDLYDTSKNFALHQQARRGLQMVFQSPYSSLNPRWRVGNIITEPIKAFAMIADRDAQTRRAHELLEQVGLSAGDMTKFPHEFSGGQRQRISIARALASNPSFIVCDEPTSALDVSVQAQVLNLLKKLQRELGLTYLFISHDMAVVRIMAHHIGVLKEGKLIEEKPADALFSAPEHDYTQTLLQATPRFDF